MTKIMRRVMLPGGEAVPALGLGTWRMGEQARERNAEVDALRAGLDLGIALVDTAEMYGEGGAEEVVAEAIKGRRDGLFIVSKVYPHNASRNGVIAACERSLKRLKTDRIDLYLLHWRGSEPLSETVAGFQALQGAGKIRHWGVSNFDVADMAELHALDGGRQCATNQVLYHLGERGIEWRLLPESGQRGDTVMAYSPLGQGTVLKNKALGEVARKLAVTPAAVAIAWTLRWPNVISIPKSSRIERVRENVKAADLMLAPDDLAALDKAFPPPKRATPLGSL